MATSAPSDRPDADRPEPVVPDPHRGEPAPAPQDGMRPEADPTLVRPAEDEPGGPLGGLLAATSAQVTDEATPAGDPSAEALLARMGVEEEGVESGQLLGLVLATLIAIAVLAVVLIYLIYSPFRGQAQARASDVDLYPELQQSRVDGRARLDQSTRTGEVYTVPIGRAMGLVVAQYGTAAADPADAARTSAVPDTRQKFNTLMVNRTAGRAVQQVPQATIPWSPPITPSADQPTPAVSGSTRGAPTDVEVGVDDLPDNPEAPEPRPDIES